MSRKHSPARARSTSRKLSVGGWVAIITTALVICGSLTAYAGYHNISSNLNQENVNTDKFGDRPTKVEGVTNILVVGSDARDGENADYGEAEGERPDTLAIAQLLPEEKSANLVNLPRDSIVAMPACDPVEGKDNKPGQEAHTGMIGEAMNSGGMQCLWKTVEQLTGVHIDHFVSVDFTGFKGMVNSVGGVPMCIPEPVTDEKAGGLELEAGKQTLNGEDALGYVRSRKGQGDGSDLSRIKRQQDFMGAMLKKVTSGDMLTSPTNINDFLASVTESLTTDDELNLSTMSDLAITMREVSMDDITFVTVPNGPHPNDPNRLQWSQPAADELFNALANGQSLAEDDKDSGGDGDGGGGSVEPQEVSAEVINATGITGLAEEVSGGLRERDFRVAGTGNPRGEVPDQTTVYYGDGQKKHAEALADELSTATVESNPALGETVQLVLSSDWDGFQGSGDSGGVPDGVEGKTASDAEVECG
ncbi:LytR family transcriptional attenuator [Haloactinospora alba]|uniref:LytR family transcriptional attenuator n=1 Tax=Haloactinospora alba TaxID=405555 RepID=A0A543NEZ6_9ACTN|nr:LCP family protein [Haloactinospora alba]TQN30396.1 LytR family transcriptional attenuator [Haloactinospora alba]